MKLPRATWRKVKLKEVCEYITVGHVGPMANAYVSSGIPFLRSQNIQPFKISLDELKFITPDFHTKLRKSALRPGDVAVVRTGYPGTAAVIPPNLAVSNCADLVVIRPSPELDPWFLTCIFNSAWGRGTVAGKLVGAAQQHFNVTAAKEMEILLPAIYEQRRIASILSAYDGLIENNARRIAILEEMARRIYEEWFVHFHFPGHEGGRMVESELGPVPEGWQATTLGRAFTTVLGGTPSRGKPEYWEQGTIPWLNSGKVNELRITKPSEYITELGLKKSAAKLMPAGTTVLAITGATLGQVSYLCAEMCANQSVVGVYDLSGKFSEYIYRFIQNRIMAIIQHASGGAQQHINKEIVNDVVILLPPDEVLERFNSVALPIGNLINTLLNKNSNLQTQRDLLLPKLISGEVDVSNLPEPEALAA